MNGYTKIKKNMKEINICSVGTKGQEKETEKEKEKEKCGSNSD